MLPQDTKSRYIRDAIALYESLKHKGNTDAIMWISLKLSVSCREAEQLIIEATTPEEEA